MKIPFALLVLPALPCACGGSTPAPCPPPAASAETAASTPSAPDAGAPASASKPASVAPPFHGAFVAERLVHEGQAIPSREVFLGDEHPNCFHFRWLWVFDESRLSVRLETLCEGDSSADGKRTDFASCVAELSTDVVWEAPDRLRVPQKVSARGEVAQLSRLATNATDSELREDKQNCSVSIDAALWKVSDVKGDAGGGQPASLALTNESNARWEVTAAVPTFDRREVIEAYMAAKAAKP